MNDNTLDKAYDIYFQHVSENVENREVLFYETMGER